MNPGDLILYRTTNIYGEYVPQFGIILNEEHHAFEYRFFKVALCGGMIKLISDHYLELIYEQH